MCGELIMFLIIIAQVNNTYRFVKPNLGHMNNDALIKLIQDWTNQVPLIILGSGASVPFKLPSMWVLGDHIINTVSFPDQKDQEQFEEFKVLFNNCGDLEQTLLGINIRPNVLREIVLATWALISKADLDAYVNIIDNKYEFPLANLIRYFLNASTKKVSIVTTNYDRIGEYAASIAGGLICTGFAQNYIGHFSNSMHRNNSLKLYGYLGQVNIWKVHGSLDWFKTPDEQEIQLPLRNTIPPGYIPSIVTPGLSKYFETHHEPYRTIFTQADNEIESANGYLCIGYGFNDEHVQPKLISQIKTGKPIIVITKTLSDKTKQLIIDNRCKNYILIEESPSGNTNVYTSLLGDFTIQGASYWQLGEYLKLIF